MIADWCGIESTGLFSLKYERNNFSLEFGGLNKLLARFISVRVLFFCFSLKSSSNWAIEKKRSWSFNPVWLIFYLSQSAFNCLTAKKKNLLHVNWLRDTFRISLWDLSYSGSSPWSIQRVGLFLFRSSVLGIFYKHIFPHRNREFLHIVSLHVKVCRVCFSLYCV